MNKKTEDEVDLKKKNWAKGVEESDECVCMFGKKNDHSRNCNLYMTVKDDCPYSRYWNFKFFDSNFCFISKIQLFNFNLKIILR